MLGSARLPVPAIGLKVALDPTQLELKLDNKRAAADAAAAKAAAKKKIGPEARGDYCGNPSAGRPGKIFRAFL